MTLPRDEIITGDNLDVMRTWPDGCVDAVVCDPPYGLTANKRRGSGKASLNEQSPAGRARIGTGNGSGGFMGMAWDSGVPPVEVWEEVLRLLKPGGYLLSFGGTRTYHRMACAIEDAGFEIRDQIQWLYGSGFPKSLDVGKAIDKAAGAVRGIVGTKNVMNMRGGAFMEAKPHEDIAITAPATDAAKQWDGWGTALKPAHEPICMARKPFPGTVAANVLEHGTGGINVDGCRIEGVPWQAHDATGLAERKYFTDGNAPVIHKEPHPQWRWPANVILDEEYIPVLCLTDSADSGIIMAIEEYYHDYTMRGVPQRLPDLSESPKALAGTLLQSALLRSVSESDTARPKSSDVRAEAQTGIAGEDARHPDAEREARQRPPELQGPLDEQGIPIPEYRSPAESTTGHGLSNDIQGSSGDSGTSSDGGNARGPSVIGPRMCPSSERNQGRQSDREPGAIQQFDAQKDAQANHAGTTPSAAGKRALEVLASDIPNCWLKYFIPTGDSIRNPECAAALLDEQSGESVSKTAPRGGTSPNPMSWGTGRKDGADLAGHTDSGGASRFYYCAKASRAERERGLRHHLPCVVCGDLHSDRHKNEQGKWVPCRRNLHPTVKPVDTMRWLCRLVTPPGGIILDPFSGSGSGPVAAKLEGLHYVGIDISEEYCTIARLRVVHTEANLFADVGIVSSVEEVAR